MNLEGESPSGLTGVIGMMGEKLKIEELAAPEPGSVPRLPKAYKV
jgi:hypothetical protein